MNDIVENMNDIVENMNVKCESELGLPHNFDSKSGH